MADKELANALIKAWQDWDNRPGDDVTAKRMTKATADVAERMGCKSHELLDALMLKRRTGLTPARTVRLLFKHIEKGERVALDQRQD